MLRLSGTPELASGGANPDIGRPSAGPNALHEGALMIGLCHVLFDVVLAGAARLALWAGSGKVRVSFVAADFADSPGSGMSVEPSGIDTASVHAASSTTPCSSSLAALIRSENRTSSTLSCFSLRSPNRWTPDGMNWS